MFLGSLGWARTDPIKSKALENVSGNVGEAPYTIQTPLGGFTFDFAQPTSIPIAMGIAAYESLLKKNKGEDDANIADMSMEILAKSGDTLFNTTMLKNVRDFFGGKYSSPTEALLGSGPEFVQQLYPSIAGQVTRTIDPIKRDESTVKNVLLSKVPFASKLVPAKVDVYGREQKQSNYSDNMALRGLGQFILPTNYKSDSNDPTSKELLRLNKATGETKFLPQFAPDKIKYQEKKKGESKTLILAPEVKEAYAKELGTESKKELDKLILKPNYKNASDRNKVKLLDFKLNDVKEKIDMKYLKKSGIKPIKR
jgi:hypothetical protein